MTKPPVCLTIAGLDPSGGAGIIADIKTFSAFGCFAAAAVSSLLIRTPPAFSERRIETAKQSGAAGRAEIFEDYEVAAINSGMLPTREVVECGRIESSDEEFGWLGFLVDPSFPLHLRFRSYRRSALQVLIEELSARGPSLRPTYRGLERIYGVAIADEDDVGDTAGVDASARPQHVIKGRHFRIRRQSQGFCYFRMGRSGSSNLTYRDQRYPRPLHASEPPSRLI